MRRGEGVLGLFVWVQLLLELELASRLPPSASFFLHRERESCLVRRAEAAAPRRVDGGTPRHLLCATIYSAGSQLPLEGTERGNAKDFVTRAVRQVKTEMELALVRHFTASDRARDNPLRSTKDSGSSAPSAPPRQSPPTSQTNHHRSFWPPIPSHARGQTRCCCASPCRNRI